jgi:4-amino-4-deoxy-L-arabinose transferase-like glycosyltransferase
MQHLGTKLAYFTREPGHTQKAFYFLLVFGVALIIRLHHLDNESLWMDELRQVSYYPHTVSQIIDAAASQSQPPLDYWIGHFVQFISTGDFAVRLPSALFGAGSVVLLTVLIASATSWQIALGFGLISALMPFNLYYSQEARPYAIAVFLFLCQLGALVNLLTGKQDKKLTNAIILLFFSAAFLHSRSLFPLVITISLLAILVSWLLFFVKMEKVTISAQKSLLVFAAVVLVLATVAYIPSLRFVLAKSDRYVSDTSMGLHLGNFLAAVIKFDLWPMWRAYVVQSEPLTYSLLLLVGLAPFFAWRLGPGRKKVIGLLTVLLLPLAGLLNMFFFQAKSSMPFRPAYASYILPLVFILGAITFQGLWTLVAKIKYVRAVRAGLMALALIFFLQTAQAAMAYKSMPRKTDWRRVSDFLTKSFDDRHVIIFDSLSHYGAWEPTLYGFPRYYRGHSPLESMPRLPLLSHKLSERTLEPVLVLFQWREYYLTPQSPYPIMSVPRADMKAIDYQRICRDPLLICNEFTGFSIFQLKEPSGNLARDSYTIIERLLLEIPKGSWLVELHLAAASLARAIQLDGWEDHLKQAEKLTSTRHLLQVTKMADRIRMMN